MAARVRPGTPSSGPRVPMRSLDAFDGVADNVDHEVGVGEHRDVAAVDVVGGGVHALGAESLELGVDGHVVVGDAEPARLGVPRGGWGRCWRTVPWTAGPRWALARPHPLQSTAVDPPTGASEAYTSDLADLDTRLPSVTSVGAGGRREAARTTHRHRCHRQQEHPAKPNAIRLQLPRASTAPVSAHS
jgi:hypothetical protein